MVAIDQLAALGYNRILTSGGVTGQVENHLATLRQLIQYAGQRLVVMPGGGVNATNVTRIVESTGCRELHGSFRIRQTASSVHASLGGDWAVDKAAIALAADMLKN